MNPGAVYAAFFMEGLHDAGYGMVVESWGCGCVELVEEVCSYVEYVEQRAIQMCLALDHSFPGVFEYEVCSPFGRWFGEHVIQHLDSPAKEQCEEQLDKLMLEFFSQGMKPEEITKLHTILHGEAP